LPTLNGVFTLKLDPLTQCPKPARVPHRRGEAEQSARAAAEAREQARAADTEAARKEAERAAEPRSAQRALEQLRGELARVRADAATEVAAAHEQTRATAQALQNCLGPAQKLTTRSTRHASRPSRRWRPYTRLRRRRALSPRAWELAWQ
jgi:hypothetical protein